jgi:hypothetical protein
VRKMPRVLGAACVAVLLAAPVATPAAGDTSSPNDNGSAAPTFGCPAKGISCAGVNILT